MSMPVAGAVPARFAMASYWRWLAPILLVAVLPPLLVYLAAAIADLNGCTLAAAGPAICIVLGADIGGALHAVATLIELTAITFPLASLAFFFWAFALIINYMAWRRKQGAYARGVVLADTTKLNVNLIWYPVVLLPIIAAGYATLMGWLPAPVLFLVIFVAIFWAISFIFALIVRLTELRKKP